MPGLTMAAQRAIDLATQAAEPGPESAEPEEDARSTV
jgi:hypothetical protein